MAAVNAIASIVSEEELSVDFIIPKSLDERVAKAVAKAVSLAAIETGVAKIDLETNKLAEVKENRSNISTR
ncbi:hypothetical protein UACE39S_02650 [Ureibacillus acetophenoni]